jgi:UDP-N-acetylglucosamine:LPS N-acetylglucosamine transferase
MKKIVFTLIAAFMTIQFINAQSISPQVVATAGNYASNGGYSVSWTLGEPVIATATNGSTTLTQGFQQPTYNVLAITNGKIEGFEVNVYPNPATDFVVVDWKTDDQNMLYISLYDVTGKMISTQTYSASQDKVSVNMSQLASAQYLLEIRNKDNTIAKIFQISKQ